MRISLDRIFAALNEATTPSQESFLGEFLLLEKPNPKEAIQAPKEATTTKREDDPNALLWLALQTTAIQQTINEHKQQCAQIEGATTAEGAKSAPPTEVGAAPVVAITPLHGEAPLQTEEAKLEEPTSAQTNEPTQGAPRPTIESKPQHKYEGNTRHALRQETHETAEINIAPRPEEPPLQREARIELTPIPKESEIRRDNKQNQELSATERSTRESEPLKQTEAKSLEMRATSATPYDASQAPQRVQLVIGEGEQQVKLSIATTEHQVKVFTQSAPPELMRSMQSSVSELQSALQQHGLNLSHFGSDSQQHEPRQREPQLEDEPKKAAAPSTAKRARAIL